MQDFLERELEQRMLGFLRGDADVLVSRMFLWLNEARRTELRARLGALIEEYRSADRDGTEMELGVAFFAANRSAT